MLVDDVRRCKQRIKGLLLFLGINEPKELEHWQNGVDAILRALPLDSAAHLTLESYLRELTFDQEELRRVELQLKSLGKSEAAASYLGLAPIVRHSGNKTPSGRLVPVGQTRLRSLLVEAAWM